MATINTIAAEARDRAGKGAARATRRAGRVPGVIYGKDFTPMTISLDPVELRKHLSRPGFFAHVFDVKIDSQTHRVLPRDVQYDPVTDRPLHVDFFRFSADTKLAVEVQVDFINTEKCPGIKAGGVLNIVRHTIEVLCAPDNIPENITVDLEGLEIGDSIHISHVKLPDDVRPTITERDFTVATIAAPSLMPSEEDEKAAAAAATAAVTPEGVPAEGEVAEAAPVEEKKGEKKPEKK